MNFAILKTEIMKAKYKTLRDNQDYQGIADDLNQRPLIDNPVARTNVPKRPTLEQVLGAIAPTDYVKVSALPDWLMNRVDSSAQCRAILLAVATNSTTALNTLFALTEPDPDWTAKIRGDSRATVLGLPVVKDFHIQKILVE